MAGGIVFLDANFNGVQDDDEPNTISNVDGSFDLEVDLTKFDKNNDGQIDSKEGKIVLTDAVDIATYLPQATPLTATPDSKVVTPLTTVIAELVEQGIDSSEAESKVKAALGVESGIDIASYDPLEAITKEDCFVLTVFASMIQVQNLIVLAAKLIDGASGADISQISSAVVGAIANKLQSGTPVDLSKVEVVQAMVSAAITKAAEKDPHLNSSQLSGLAADVAKLIATGNKLVQEFATSEVPLKEAATQITRLQKVSVGQIAVNLQDVGAGTKSIQDLLAQNTVEALEAKLPNVEVNDPTVRPVVGSADFTLP